MSDTPTLPHTVFNLIEVDATLDLLTASLSDESLRAAARTKMAECAYVPHEDEVTLVLEEGARCTIGGLARWDPTFEPVKGPADRRRFEEVAKAWLLWSNHQPAQVPDETKIAAAGGGMNLMAYNTWGLATKALIANNTSDAERYFRRVLELGQQYEITHFRLIRWTYVASFFHSGLTSAG